MAIRDIEYGPQGWYPVDPGDCREQIDRYVRGLPAPSDPPGSRHGGVVPHAGWRFSGHIAAGVFHALSAETPDTVVVYGHHLGPRSLTVVMADGGWRTPLGDLATDVELVRAIGEGDSHTLALSDWFRTDNTIELQLPFVKHFFPDARIVAVGAAPDSTGLAVADRIAAAARATGRRLLAIGSTDLTHYGPNYGFTPHGRGDEALAWVKDINDKGSVDRMLDLDADGLIREALANHNACCPGAAAAAIRTALSFGANRAKLIEYATSADITPSASFVGYAGVVF